MNTSQTAAERPTLLNVGGNNKSIALPDHFQSYEHLLLDIDPTVKPDVLCDARELSTLASGQFDAIYCSHNLEHYYRHDVPKVLAGFLHVLKPSGCVHIRVPDLIDVMKSTLDRKLDLDSVLYTSPAGPIDVLDVIYGWGEQIARSGVDFYAHKTGFSESLLTRVLKAAGFKSIYVASGGLEISALAFVGQPSSEQRAHFGLPPQG